MSDLASSLGSLFGCRQWVGALLLFGVLVSIPPIARAQDSDCLLYTSPSPRDQRGSRMPSSA